MELAASKQHKQQHVRHGHLTWGLIEVTTGRVCVWPTMRRRPEISIFYFQQTFPMFLCQNSCKEKYEFVDTALIQWPWECQWFTRELLQDKLPPKGEEATGLQQRERALAYRATHHLADSR